jgi:hypothetical protein
VLQQRKACSFQIRECEAEASQIARLVCALGVIRIQQVAEKLGVLDEGFLRIWQLHGRVDNFAEDVLKDENGFLIDAAKDEQFQRADE